MRHLRSHYLRGIRAIASLVSPLTVLLTLAYETVRTSRLDCECTCAPCMTRHHSMSASTRLLLASETPLRLPGRVRATALADAVDDDGEVGGYGATALRTVGEEAIRRRAGGIM